MSIKVSELLQQPTFSAFRVVAGINGLNRSVNKVNILDFEYDAHDDEQEVFGLFEQEAFVLSSLLFAKDHAEMILKSVQRLIRDGASALAIKEIYYHELPQEAIDYANEHQFPILMFQREGGYFETIITELTHLIETKNHEELNEKKLSLLLDEALSKRSQHLLIEELFPHLQPPYFAMYLETKPNCPCYRFKAGYFVIGNEKLKSHNRIGISLVHEGLDEVQLALKESLVAYEYASKVDQKTVVFNELGLYQFLYPLKENVWLSNYMQRLNQCIEEDSHGEELMQTAKTYIQCHYDVQEAAKQLHIHKNTVRYRIQRLRELLVAEHEEAYFETQLTLFVLMNQISE